MIRRIFSISIVLGILIFAALLLSNRNAYALTPTVSRTPTIGCGSVIVVTSTASPTLSPTPRVATATTTPSCGPIYITATPGTVAAGPDVTIGSITYAGSSPACANAPKNNVVVVNNGNVAAGAFVVSYSIGGSVVATQTVNGLAAGQSIVLSFQSASGAGISVSATADSTNVIAETNEFNNTNSAVLPIPTQAATCTPAPVTPTVTPTATNGIAKADLSYPYNAYWVWDPKAYDSVNGCYNSVPVLVWRVDVKNTGSADAGSFVIGQNYDRQQVIAGLPVGATASVYFPFPGGPGATAVAGQPTLAPGTSNFIADYNNTVDESNETNNRTVGYIPTFTATPSGGPTRVFCKAATSTPTPTATLTPTPTNVCMMTTVPMIVGAVTSPTSALTQIINVTLPGGASVTITSQAGTFTSTTRVGNVFSVTVNLVANSTNNLTIVGTVPASGGCAAYSQTATATIFQAPDTITITPSRTPTVSPTPTATAFTPACTPVNATIAAPFTQDGVGSFCWQSSNLGSAINSWNLTSLTINGLNYTNQYVAVGSYPAKVGGYWYIRYTSNVAWGHFEAK